MKLFALALALCLAVAVRADATPEAKAGKADKGMAVVAEAEALLLNRRLRARRRMGMRPAQTCCKDAENCWNSLYDETGKAIGTNCYWYGHGGCGRGQYANDRSPRFSQGKVDTNYGDGSDGATYCCDTKDGNRDYGCASYCYPCQTGRYQTGCSLGPCKLCPKGTYNKDYGSTSKSACKACDSGKYQNEEGQSECMDCPADWVLPEDKSFCIPPTQAPTEEPTNAPTEETLAPTASPTAPTSAPTATACQLAIDLCKYTSPHEFTSVGAPDSLDHSWCQKNSRAEVDVVFTAQLKRSKTIKIGFVNPVPRNPEGGSGMSTMSYRELRARRFSAEHFLKLWRCVVSI